MKISSVIADILQIINRSHNDLQNLDADDHTQYLDVAGTRPPTNVQSGVDASKSGTPDVGDIYFSTDTNELYLCKTNNSWELVAPFKTYLFGADASKSATPDVGDIYYSTDTNELYLCKTDDVWTLIAPFSLTNVPTRTTVSDNLKNSNDDERYTEELNMTKLKEIVINADLDAVRIKFDIKTKTTQAAYGQIYKNGATLGAERFDTTGSYQTFSEDFTNLVKDDLIQMYGRRFTTATGCYIKNFRFYYNAKATITHLKEFELTTPVDTENATTDPISATNQDP